MKIKKILSCLVLASMLVGSFNNIPRIQPSITTAIAAEATTDGDFSLNEDTLTIKKGSDEIDLEVCSSTIMRVNYKPGGAEDPNTLVLDPNKKWDTGNIVSSDLKSDPAIIKTKNMTIKIAKSDLSISVYDSSNGLLVKQSSIADAKSISFTHNSGENFYGISGYGCGTNANDGALRNNNSYDVTCAGQGWAGGPFTWSTGGYGLLVDSDGGKITTGDTSLSYQGISKKDAEYFIIVGKPEEIMKGVSEISGNSPMYPKWAMGFTDTQWGWAGSGTVEDQVKSVIGTYRSKNIPIDNFCFDFDWKHWGEPDKDYGEFTWNSKNFPSAASGALKKWQEANGIHFTGIIKPRIFTGVEASRTTAQYATAKENGWTFGGGSDYCASKAFSLVDFSSQGARDWWWKCTQDAYDKGLCGYWNDEVDHENGYGNFGNFNLQRAQYEGQRKYTDDSARVWSINRNFYLGAQRYSYGVWTGDINTGFASMKGQAGKLIAAVNLGENKWGMDTGGFNGGDPSSENYARWIEFSAFTPIFRVHGQDCRTAEQAPNTGRGTTPRYPWNFGATAEAASKKVMQLRYKLLPYIYKYERDAYEGGTGIVKPLMMVYPNDKKVQGEVYSWMFGDNLLVSPVLDQGITSKSIYLPAGTWIDYASGKVYSGGQTIDYAVDATKWDDVPLFIKQGAIIPTQDYQNYVGEKKMTNIYVDVFPDTKETSFEYYDDDSNSYDYEKGVYFKQKLSVSRNDDWSGVEFKTGPKDGSYTPDVKYYIVKLHVKATGDVTVGGKKLTKYKSLDELTSATGEGYATGMDVYGDVAYAKVAAGEVKLVNAPCDFPEAPEESATVYAKTKLSSAGLEYSVDGGSTWSKEQAMTQSDKLGYLQAKITYKLSSNNPVYVRYSANNEYYPSDKGVQLDGDDSIFTIGKDGKVSTGEPAMKSANIYIQTDKTNPVQIQYKEDGIWSSGIELDPYGTEAGQNFKALSYPADNSEIAVRYSEDYGVTWKPSRTGQTISSGDYMNDSTGNIVAGRPNWSNSVIIYYKKGYASPYILWRPTGGTWLKAPGDKMSDSEKDGYTKAVLDIGTATSAEVCFNDGSGKWDNNGGKNYTFQMGTNIFEAGKITQDGAGGNTGFKVIPSIIGGVFRDAQTIKLTSSDSSAVIYYTLDGTAPSTSSTKYTDAIKISKNTTLQAIAVDAKGNKSAVSIQKYTIDPNAEVDPVEPDDPKEPDDQENPDDQEDPDDSTTADALKSVKLSANIKSLQPGDKVKFTAKANTTDSSVQYSFGYYDGDNEWNQLRKYSSSNTFEWTTDSEGSFNVIVRAKSDNVDPIESSAVKVTISSDQQTEEPGDTFDNNSIVNVLGLMTLALVSGAVVGVRRKRVR